MPTKPETVPTLKDLNKNLRQTLGLAKDINRNRIRRDQVRVESHLEEELKRRKLTTNEPG
jgi:hypothetical protein